MLRACYLFKKPDWLKKVEVSEKFHFQIAVIARDKSKSEAKFVVGCRMEKCCEEKR
jgi:hypothetical protein